MSFLPLILILLSPVQARAAVWSWEKSVEQTAKSNPEVEAARQTLSARESQRRSAFAGFFPKLTASFGYTYGTGRSSSQTGLLPDGTGTGERSTYSASLTLTENLFSGFADKAKIDGASATRDVAQAQLTAARAKASADLKAAFAGVAYAKKAKKLTEDIIRRRESNLKLIELRFESGRENRGSFLLSRGYLEQSRLDHLQAENSIDTYQAQLARVLGIDERAELDVSGAVPIAEPPAKVNLEELTLRTPEYLQSVGDESSAEAAWVTARSGFFPTLSLTGTTANSDDRFFPQNNRWSVGATLNFPLFNGGSDYYGMKAASDLAKAAALAKDNALRQGKVKLRQALASFQEAVQKLEVDTRFQEAATTRAKIAREKYNNGLLSFEDWDIIENDLINRQKNLLQSERDRVVAQAEWERTQGKGVIQ